MRSYRLPKIFAAIVQKHSTDPEKASRISAGPSGMAGEQPMDKAHFVNDKQAKDEAHHAACSGKNDSSGRSDFPKA